MGLGLGLGCLLAAATFEAPILVWNATPSLPQGLYRATQQRPERNDLVLIRLPARTRALAARRGYLPRSAYLLKPVVARDGDVVCRVGRRVTVRGRFAAQAQRFDGLGRPMPNWHGCRRLGPDTLFLLAPHADSFDSRYFGPVSAATLVAGAVLIWSLRTQNP